MVRLYGRSARKNLREGAKKMEQVMSSAARVRREFRLGRPPKQLAENEQPEPLRPDALWRRATGALSDLRARMNKVTLNPRHAAAAIVYVEQADPDSPCLLALEENGKTPEEMQQAAFDVLNRTDVIALGMMFVQLDGDKRAIFPYLFYGLNARGMDVLKRAAAMEYEAGELLKNVN